MSLIVHPSNGSAQLNPKAPGFKPVGDVSGNAHQLAMDLFAHCDTEKYKHLERIIDHIRAISELVIERPQGLNAPQADADEPVAVIPHQEVEKWQPLAVRQFPPLDSIERDNIPFSAELFTLDFLRDFTGAVGWGPGFYWSKLGHSFYLVDPEFDPFVPAEPGQHGAKLVAFFKDNADVEGYDDEAFMNAPLFVAQPSTEDSTGLQRVYAYYGNYSQTRFSEKLDHDNMVEKVPVEVKLYWARELASTERPEWVTKALKEHFYPQPRYEGSFDWKLSRTGDKLSASIRDHLEDLQEWYHQADKVVADLTSQAIMDAFDSADCGHVPGLRLQWEYLQCVSFDNHLLKTMIDARDSATPKTKPHSAASPHPSSPMNHPPLLRSKKPEPLSMMKELPLPAPNLAPQHPRPNKGWDIVGPSKADYDAAAAVAPRISPRAHRAARIEPAVAAGKTYGKKHDDNGAVSGAEKHGRKPSVEHYAPPPVVQRIATASAAAVAAAVEQEKRGYVPLHERAREGK
ncbi:hypothetical protein ANO11243_029630 [Dothideomycetidae sp. 11243]|nr:hypothetical protein ANO11243_029630 [fungal sp. No.11243]